MRIGVTPLASGAGAGVGRRGKVRLKLKNIQSTIKFFFESAILGVAGERGGGG